MAAPNPAPRPARPILRQSLSSNSFIQDHQQYKPPVPVTQNIEDVLGVSRESLLASLSNLHLNSMSPDPENVTESGIIHTIFNQQTNPLSTGTSKLVATLFYKSANPVHPHLHPDSSLNANNLPSPTVPVGSAPTIDMEKIPREPPAPEPEPLDHLYGPFVSQLCLTNFLQIIESLSTPYQRMNTSHRCLDKDDQPRVVEVTLSPPPNPEYLSFGDLRKHESIWRFEREWNVEVVLQKESVFRRHKRLVVFDMDSTLIQNEVIDEIAKFIGVEKEVSDITERAMNGELDFSASLRERVGLLKGVPADVFEKLKSVITISPGARELCRALKKLGCKLAVLSGGFQPLAEWLAEQLGIDYAFANHLEVDAASQTLTGKLVPTYPIIDASKKRELLKSLAADNGIPISQVVSVGDGANDLLMLHAAGLGVAWRAKTKVQLEAPTRLNGESMDDILYLFGLTREDIKELIAEDA
ncbi:phosphoserine phosphatase SerB [Aspergillus clavatus NRRL 1]|uniref:phosphoserine phosphatase n=1 Tax=Aspergillus clavatus (strain ATCC 1007 / CBS 513.65 / DSM 816 / NCTC 3887 / NRRL 1 / QM 1276 / 107) TaxID=344612 RepID=A1CJC3_ASPCL|nr:phosphoserine phosphatase [Aspergillus clavatus NRRL 1]EAW09247.1 phosphoserine phosphatase [Aspergillus clavatus NRRL 1]